MKPFATIKNDDVYVGQYTVWIGKTLAWTSPDEEATKLHVEAINAAHRAMVRDELIALKEWCRGKTELVANIDIDAFMDREDKDGTV